MSKRVLLSLRAYAKHRKDNGLTGGSLAAVQKAVKGGRVKLVDGKVDPEQADRDWDQNSDKRQQRKPRAADTPPVTRPVDEGEPPAETNEGSFAEAQRQHEWEKVRRQRMARLQEEKRYVDIEVIGREVIGLIAAAKTRLRAIGAKLAPELAVEAEPAKCQALVDAEVDEALAELSRWEPRAA